MTELVGVDGCADGWLFIVERNGDLSAGVAADVVSLLESVSDDAIVAIDVPIGLTHAGPRACDLAARRLLQPLRGSSVFPAPVRACLGASTYDEACDAHQRADGRRMSRQAFGITRKIAEVDKLMSCNPMLQSRVREVHPEVCFALWNAGKALTHAKRKLEGRREREALIDAVWPGQREELRRALRGHRHQADDLYDAFAALWTARRIRDAEATVLPTTPPIDAFGLRMEIVA